MELIGIFFVLKVAYKIIKFIYLNTIKGYPLLDRYGKNTWVLITGASDGIGRQFGIELARQGFNICLLGRNREKLQKAE